MADEQQNDPWIDRLETIIGSDRWQSESTPYESRLQNFVDAHVNSGSSALELQRNAMRHFPGADVQNLSRLHQEGTTERQLTQERKRAEGMDESWSHYVGSRLPFASLGELPHQIAYTRARARYQAGTATPEDLRTIAERERFHKIEADRTTGQQALGAIAHVPGMVAEAFIGGGLIGGAGLGGSIGNRATRLAASTAAMPSMWLPEMVNRNVEQGRQAHDLRGAPAAFVMGMMQVGVLHAIGGIGQGISGKAIFPTVLRAMTRTAVGMGGQHLAVEPVAEAVSTVLPQAYRLNTGDGLLSNAFQGKWGEAWKQFAVSLVTFAAFSGYHEVQSRMAPAAPPTTPPGQTPPGPPPWLNPAVVPPGGPGPVPGPGSPIPRPSGVNFGRPGRPMDYTRRVSEMTPPERIPAARARETISNPVLKAAESFMQDLASNDVPRAERPAALQRINAEMVKPDAKQVFDAMPPGPARDYAAAILARREIVNPSQQPAGHPEVLFGQPGEQPVAASPQPPAAPAQPTPVQPPSPVAQAAPVQPAAPPPAPVPTQVPEVPSVAAPPRMSMVERMRQRTEALKESVKPLEDKKEVREVVVLKEEKSPQEHAKDIAAGLPGAKEKWHEQAEAYGLTNRQADILADRWNPNLPKKERSLRALEEKYGISRTQIMNDEHEAMDKFHQFESVTEKIAKQQAAAKIDARDKQTGEGKTNLVDEKRGSGVNSKEKSHEARENAKTQAVTELAGVLNEGWKHDADSTVKMYDILRATVKSSLEENPALRKIGNERKLEAIVRAEHPEFANEMSAKQFSTFIRMIKGAINVYTGEAGDPASFQRLIKHGVQEASGRAKVPPQGQGGPEVQRPPEGPRPAEVPDARAPDSGPDPSAPSRTGAEQAGGDKLTNADKADALAKQAATEEKQGLQAEFRTLQEAFDHAVHWLGRDRAMELGMGHRSPKGGQKFDLGSDVYRAIAKELRSGKTKGLKEKIVEAFDEGHGDEEGGMSFGKMGSNIAAAARRLYEYVSGSGESSYEAKVGEFENGTYALYFGGRKAGEITLGKPGRSEKNAADRMFPGWVKRSETVSRIHGIDVSEEYRGQGNGQKLYLSAMDKAGADWYYNSQTEPGATNALLSLQKKGLAEVHWKGGEPSYGEEGGIHLVRITEEGRRAARGLADPRAGAAWTARSDLKGEQLRKLKEISDEVGGSPEIADLRRKVQEAKKSFESSKSEDAFGEWRDLKNELMDKKAELINDAMDKKAEQLTGKNKAIAERIFGEGGLAGFHGGEDGFMPQIKFKEMLKGFWDYLKSGRQDVEDIYGQHGGRIYPKTARKAPQTADKLVQYISGSEEGRLTMEKFKGQIIGEKTTDAEARKIGTMLNEMTLRHTEEYYREQARKPGVNPVYEREMLDLADEVKTFIGAKNSDFQTQADYDAFRNSARGQEVETNWRGDFQKWLDEKFRDAKDMAPTDPIVAGTQIPGMTINLLHGDPDNPTPGTVEPISRGGGSRGDLAAAKMGKPGFLKQRTGSGSYETDVRKIIENSIRQHLNYVNKKELIDTAEAEGSGRRGRPGDRRGDFEGATEFKDVFPRKPESSFYVFDKDVAHDFRQAWAQDEPVRFKTVAGVAKALNVTTLVATQELVSHSKNILTTMANPKVLGKMIGAIADVWTKAPGAMDRLIELAHIGVSVGAHQEGSKYNPLTYGSKVLHFLRKSAILAADRAFTDLAKNPAFDIKDTVANRRNFINQVGQYNIKGQNAFTKLLRDTGLGPFATAGMNFWVQGIRSLTGNPGIETNSVRGQAMLRAWKYANLATVVGIGMGLNYLINGRVDGDEQTPLGAIKLGKDKNGKTQYFDIVALTGLTRGARQTGLLAIAEGTRRGRPVGAIGDSAVSDIVHSAIHPAMGPTVQFAHMFYTGENSMGMRVAPRLSESHAVDNALAAAKNINPLVASLGGFNRSPESQPLSIQERAMSLAGPYGVKTREAVGQWREALRDLETRRQLARQVPGQRFEREADYQRLHRISSAMQRIDQQLKIITNPETRQQLRQRQNELARQALG